MQKKCIKISLAGDLGSGKTTVGALLAERFSAEKYSTGTIQRKIALEMGMSTLELNRYMEQHHEIDKMIDDGLCALEGEEKNLIIDSRMAWHFVPSSFAVYMQAEPLVSAARILAAGRASEHFESVEEAAASIRARRASEAARYEMLYGVNICDMENYDYVVDTTYVPPETVAEHIAARFEAAAAGKAFPRYALCPARLYPYGEEEGEPAFFEENGSYFIARGAKEIAERIRAGAPLIALERAEKGAGACTAAAVRAWEERTGVRFPALPACAKE